MVTAFEIDTRLIEREVSSIGISTVRPATRFVELCESARADYLAAFKTTTVQPPKKAFRPSDLAVGP